jgi:hypothetical protein
MIFYRLSMAFSLAMALPKKHYRMYSENQDGRWCYEKKPVPNAKW